MHLSLIKLRKLFIMGRTTFNSGIKNIKNDQMEIVEQSYMTQQQDPTRVIFLSGDVNEHSIANVIVQLLFLASQNHQPIHMIVSTYGGSVDEMFSLYDTIKFLPCPVHTVALGKVMSAGVLLLASGVKGYRLIGRSARIMIHPVSAGSSGNIFEQISSTTELKRQHELLVESLRAETKMTSKELKKIMLAGHDCYLTPKEAIQMGIVDKFIGE